MTSESRERLMISLNESEIQARIEAALYAAGRPLSPKELASAAGITSKRKALKATRDLARILNSNLKAIEIVELADQKFAMQLRKQYSKIAKRFSTKPLLSSSVLKTLSYVAYFQPVSRLELAEKRGKQAYQHLKILEEIGFISGEPFGRTRVYKTTPAFSEYFGLSSDLETMRKQLFKKNSLLKNPKT
ncbi:MAG: SMC-Scp complex subunit ScpB [archaeon]|nr:SMC-Scp complex subunit ScpB [archaeon]